MSFGVLISLAVKALDPAQSPHVELDKVEKVDKGRAGVN